jgi:hypothetical protein
MVLGFAADKTNTPALWALIIGTHVLTSYLVSILGGAEQMFGTILTRLLLVALFVQTDAD